MPRSFVIRRNVKLGFDLHRNEDLKCAKVVYRTIEDTPIEKAADSSVINNKRKASCDDPGFGVMSPSSEGIQERETVKTKESRDDAAEKQMHSKEVNLIPNEIIEDNKEGMVTAPTIGEASQSEKYCVFKCPQCGKTFRNIHTYTVHMSMPEHSRTRPFACRTCGKGFRLSSTLSRHKIIHTNQRPHKCQLCGKAFNRSSTLKSHMKTHDNDESFSCQICRCNFHDKDQFYKHIMLHSTVDSRARIQQKVLPRFEVLLFGELWPWPLSWGVPYPAIYYR